MVGTTRLDAVAPVHADEPLVHRAEDQFRLAAPAVRVHVRILLARHQEPRGLERRHDVVGHLAGVAAGERPEAVDEDRALIQRGDERDAVVLAQLLVFRAATGRDMDQARAFGFADGAPGDDAMRGGRGGAAAGVAVREDAAGCVLRCECVEGARKFLGWNPREWASVYPAEQEPMCRLDI